MYVRFLCLGGEFAVYDHLPSLFSILDISLVRRVSKDNTIAFVSEVHQQAR